MIVLDTEAVQRSLSVLWSRLEEALEAVGEAEGHKREREALEHKVRFLEQELAGLRTVAEEAEGLKLQLARCEREREQYERSEQREQQQGGPSGLEEEVRSLRADLQTLNAYLGDLEKDLEDRDNRISQLKDEATSR